MRTNQQTEIADAVQEILNNPMYTKILNDFTREEMEKAINRLRNNKATGPDKILGEMIKNSPEPLKQVLLKIFNKIKSTCEYPEEWAKGITSLILKDDEDPNNYRAITVASALSKILAIMINERINDKVTTEGIIGPQQIGFRKGARTADHLFILKNCIDNYVNRGKKMYACFIDFQKAYDNVWRTGMYYKLIKYGVDIDTIKLIKNMYDKTSQIMRINNKVTAPFKTTRGVRQGCVLSPLLFNLFINDLPDIFDDTCKPVKIGNSRINCLMYADDIVLMSENIEGLQKCIEQLEKYTEMWDMSLNKKNTKIVVFQGHGRQAKINIKFKGEYLDQADKYKYLGTIISNTGSFKKNNSYIKAKALRARYMITKNIGLR